jgi:imidazolonepropionase
MKADLVISNIGQLVTCASDGKPKRGAAMRDIGLVENGAIAVVDGKIAAVGRASEIERAWVADEVVDADQNVVCPGFVDPHTHIVFAGDRLNEFELKIQGADYLEILAAGGGILSTVKATREASFDELVKLGLKRLDKMLACGTTTAEIKTGYGLDHDTEMRMLQVIEELDKEHSIDIVPTFLAAHAIPSQFRGQGDEYLDQICKHWILEVWDWWSLSRFFGKAPCFVDIYCEKGAYTPEQMSKLINAVAELKGFLGFKAHVDQFNNLGGSRIAIEAGATSIDHLDVISDDEIVMLASSDTIGVVIPTENFNSAKSNFAPARKMIDAGCGIALSTDYNPGSAPCPSQPTAIAIACRYQKLLPVEAMNAATINAAFAIGLGDNVGSIEIGKSADLLICDVTDYRELAYEFGSTAFRQVIKAGETVLN